MENSSIRSSASGSARAERRSRVLPAGFYARPTLEVARDLLGKLLTVKTRAGRVTGRIVETEAYGGTDPASHSSRGETPRCSVMFGDPGVAYVYFIYGMYEMLNFVTEPKGKAGAVLIRALEPVDGRDLMARRRGLKLESRKALHVLTAGPGRLCQAMGIKMSHNGAKVQGPVLVVSDDGFRPASISASPRVGITVGTDKAWRFFVTGNAFVSRAPQNSKARVL